MSRHTFLAHAPAVGWRRGAGAFPFIPSRGSALPGNRHPFSSGWCGLWRPCRGIRAAHDGVIYLHSRPNV